MQLGVQLAPEEVTAAGSAIDAQTLSVVVDSLAARYWRAGATAGAHAGYRAGAKVGAEAGAKAAARHVLESRACKSAVD